MNMGVVQIQNIESSNEVNIVTLDLLDPKFKEHVSDYGIAVDFHSTEEHYEQFLSRIRREGTQLKRIVVDADPLEQYSQPVIFSLKDKNNEHYSTTYLPTKPTGIESKLIETKYTKEISEEIVKDTKIEVKLGLNSYLEVGLIEMSGRQSVFTLTSQESFKNIVTAGAIRSYLREKGVKL